MGDVAGTIELTALASVPECVETRSVFSFQCLGDDGVATTDTCESCCLGETAELDGTLFCSFYLVDGMWQGVIADESLVGSIVKDDCLMTKGVIDPCGKFLLRDDSSRGVVGIAQVDDIEMLCWDVAREVVAGMTGNVAKTTSCHDVGIDIHRIYGVGNANNVIRSKDVAYITCVAFGTIADKHFIIIKLDAARSEVMSNNGIDEEAVTLFRTIATEGFGVGVFIDSTMHGANSGRR